ncbi:helix-turn-helix domain-containing protein [Runella sp. SP2]|uniref:helix-turn-helix domain-containing protein n=1 Tax=Runella sp. SP2 TaxID=2268026 RepID=UPI000F0788D1|nr:helix-turn-helix transcriptional regulator [Runella sp. SP2]AYQ30981.1 XRE family transcriptional regulator [Runella sp. SP2]
MSTTLNTDLLATMLRARRGKNGLRTVAEEIGDVSVATLSRIEQGKIPDVDTFIKICLWLEVPTDTFVMRNEEVAESNTTQQTIVAHLRADRELDAETMQMLVKLVNLAYSTKSPRPISEN